MVQVSIGKERAGNITVYFRDVRTTKELDYEITVDVDRDGRWVRGIELLGGPGFDLGSAVGLFSPVGPLQNSGADVTYDPEADAAYFYIPTKSLTSENNFVHGSEVKYANSLTTEARLGLDQEGGLVWISFRPEFASGNLDEFLARTDASVQKGS